MKATQKDIAIFKKIARPCQLILAGLFLLALGLGFLVNINPSYPIGSLDMSWLFAVNYLPQTSFTYGKDTVFTYGPLGYLLMQYGGMHAVKGLVFNLCTVILLIILLIGHARSNPGNLKRLAVFGVVYLVFMRVPSMEWIWAITLLLLIFCIWQYQDKKCCFYILCLLAGVMANMSLFLKFNLAALSVGLAGLLGIWFLIFRCKKFLPYFLIFSVTWLVLTIIGILAMFDGFGYFLLWLKASMEITSGFNHAMVVDATSYFLELCAISAVLYLAMLFVPRKSLRQYGILLVLSLFFVFIAFKNGFVQANSHMYHYFTTIPYAAGFLFLFSSGKTALKQLATFVLIAATCSIYDYHPIMFGKPAVEGATATISKVVNYRRDKQLAASSVAETLQAYQLPEHWRAIMGDDAWQATPWHLLFAPANNLRGWQPSRVLQLYSAYTPYLDELNAESFTGDTAPEFVIYEFIGFARQNNFTCYPVSMETLRDNYDVLDVYGEKALLRRKPVAPEAPAFRQFAAQTVNYGETIFIPSRNEPVYARIYVENSLEGKIMTTLYKGCISDMTIYGATGGQRTHRIVTANLRNPVLVSAVPASFAQSIAWLKGDLDGFQASHFTISHEKPELFEQKITIEWLTRSPD